MPRISRRGFLVGSAAALAGWPAFAEERPMPLRPLGRTGLEVSLAGLGTAQLSKRIPDEVAIAIVRRAVDLGVSYIDTAFSYGHGDSERKIGLALEGIRDRVLLNTKTQRRDRKGALRELDESLKRLRTDHVDVWQFHSLRTTGDIDAILGEDGALAAGLEAKKAGKVRFLGITGHYRPQVFVDALGRHDFDTLLIPLNCIDPHHLSFEEHALPVANRKKTAVIAMKVFCSRALPDEAKIEAEDCLRYTYGLPIATCIVGCESVREIELAAHVARNLEVMDGKERAALLERTKPHSPELEWYKK